MSTVPTPAVAFDVPDNNCGGCGKSLSDCNCEGVR